MMLVVPGDSPACVLLACANAPYPSALIRTEEKPEPLFLLRFPLILDRHEIPQPENKDDLVLVSPNYDWICWAKAKNLRAVWLNFEGDLCPLAHPVHDLELRDPKELEKPLRFTLPDLPEALQILRRNGVPENVVRHSAAVAAVAHFLAERLRNQGVPVDPLLAHRGGLLHDLDKIESVKENCVHGEKAAEILASLGYPKLAEIARAHVLRPRNLPKTWEEKLVFYADKLVEEDKVVGLEARLSALRARYPEFLTEIQSGEPFLMALHAQILLTLDLGEPELLRELQGIPLELPAGIA